MDYFTLTNLLVGLNIIISFIAFQNKNITNNLLFHPVSIRERKEYYRFLTSGFIHADIMHLAFNMIALFSFGNNIEYLFSEIFGPIGRIYYFFMYLSAIPVASLYDYFKNKENNNYAALGASGGVAAIIFSCILFDPYAIYRIYFIPIPAILFGVLYIVYTVYMSRKGNDNIGHFAHLFGSVYGVLFTIAIYPLIVPYFFQQLTHLNFH